MGGYGTPWDRDRVFNAVISALRGDLRYRDKLMPVKPDSMCVKVDLAIKVEILPVVRNIANIVTDREPFYLWRPQRNRWELGYASNVRKYAPNDPSPSPAWGCAPRSCLPRVSISER